MYKVKQFGSGSEPAGCLSKQQLSNQACFKAATAKKNHLQDPLAQKCVFYGNFNKVHIQLKPRTVLEQIPVHHSTINFSKMSR